MHVKWRQNMQNQKPLTIKSLSEITGAPYYTIQYLKQSKRLPIIKESSGSGYPTHYHPKAIDVIKEHLSKQSTVS